LDAPAGCPSSAEIVAAITSVVHTVPPEPLRVSAQITREAQHFALNTSFSGGERRVQGDSCGDVSRALVAIVALAIDPSAEVSAVAFPRADSAPGNSDAAPAPTPTSDPAREPAPPARVEKAPVLTERRAPNEADRAGLPLELGASLWALGEWGMLPSPSYGVAGVLRGSLGPWSAELGGSWLRPRWAEVPSAPDKGGDISWFALQGNACRALAGGAAACAGIEVGELSGEGSNVAQEDGGSALWLAPSLGASWRAPLGPALALEARIVGAFPLLRPEFSIEPYGALHRPSWVSGRLSLGIAYR
jgi:hypothetical protein